MREIEVSQITALIKEMCKEANYHMPNDIIRGIESALQIEESPIGKEILEDICTNATIAKQEQIPICQDTGTAVLFIKIGQDVHFVGGSLKEAIHEGVRQGYTEGYLRKSIVENPLYRKNTGDNTPAIIHYEVVEGEEVELLLAPKGGGSENMSKVYMLTPSQGIDGVEKAVVEAVTQAGPNACLPVVIGIGLGGNFEECTLLAKKALTRSVGSKNPDERMHALEKRLLDKVNNLGIGPQGLGGTTTALGVHIEDAPCHIASMPLAINMGCHVNRHVTRKV